MRVCVVYDCLFPWTVGGAERWCRSLAERLAADGHEVTYLTRLQWAPDDPPAVAGVTVVAVSRDEPLYGADGARVIGEALRFGYGVFRHLAANRGRYDVVHAASFPYFSVLGARLATIGTPTRLLIDWHEVWTRAYWTTYVGRAKGLVGWLVQRAATRVRHQPFVFSEMNRARLVAEAPGRHPIRFPGLHVAGGGAHPPRPAAEPPTVLFVGRQIPEKAVLAVVPAVVRARSAIPSLRATIIGDGPDRAALERQIADLGAGEFASALGFVDGEVLERELSRALCLLLPSRREGYGMVVIEAAAAGTPSIVTQGPDNAAVELVEEGVNGLIAASDAPETLAAAIVAVHRAGMPLRESSAAWFARNAGRLSIDASLDIAATHYAALSSAPSA